MYINIYTEQLLLWISTEYLLLQISSRNVNSQNVFILCTNLSKHFLSYSFPTTLRKSIFFRIAQVPHDNRALSSKGYLRKATKRWGYILTKFSFPFYFKILHCFDAAFALILIIYALSKISNQRRNIWCLGLFVLL